METAIEIEIAGFKKGGCGPFPCDEHRTCGLEECYPDGDLQKACLALDTTLKKEFGDGIIVRVTLLDNGIPEHIRQIVEKYHPPVPMILVNGSLFPLGRVSFNHMKKYLSPLIT